MMEGPFHFDGSGELLTVPPSWVGRFIEPFPFDGSDERLSLSPLMVMIMMAMLKMMSQLVLDFSTAETVPPDGSEALLTVFP